jgi:ATP-binding cassette subfamily A (ABC1) protein 5
MGYCPQHDAQWKNITVREHLECYAAIRGVPPSDINRYGNMNVAAYRVIKMHFHF